MSTTNTRVEAHRVDACRVRIDTPSGLDITLLANDQVPVDRASLAEVGTLSGIHDTLGALNRARFFGDAEAAIRRCVLTPDFHKGAGVPVGTVVDAHGFVAPRLPGGDIGCGIFRTSPSRLNPYSRRARSVAPEIHRRDPRRRSAPITLAQAAREVPVELRRQRGQRAGRASILSIQTTRA